MRARLSRLMPGWNTFVPAFYWGATYLLRFVLWIVGRWSVSGRENVPAEGPLIVVANHLSNTDPPILAAGLATRRRVRYMAKIELFNSALGPIVRLYGAFPVRRFEADIAAMLNAERVLKHGGILGMFPEGTRSRSGMLGKPHPGTAMIALRSGATVLPCAVTGTEQIGHLSRLLRKPRISVVIGRPMRIEAVRRPTEAQVNELSERIFAEVRALLPSQYLAAYTESERTAASTHGGDHPGI